MTAMKKPAKKRKPVTIWCFNVKSTSKSSVWTRSSFHDAVKAHIYLLQFPRIYTLGRIVKIEVPW